MANFKLKTITTKKSKFCIVCRAEHKTGAVVPMQFSKYFGKVQTRIVCDGDCLAQLAEREKPAADKFLDKLSVQFN